MKPSNLAALVGLAVATFLPSCAGITSGLTGQPIATVKVQGPSGIPFAVASQDVLRAETQLGKAWGLYDAGAVADTTGQVIQSSK